VLTYHPILPDDLLAVALLCCGKFDTNASTVEYRLSLPTTRVRLHDLTCVNVSRANGSHLMLRLITHPSFDRHETDPDIYNAVYVIANRPCRGFVMRELLHDPSINPNRIDSPKCRSSPLMRSTWRSQTADASTWVLLDDPRTNTRGFLEAVMNWDRQVTVPDDVLRNIIAHPRVAVTATILKKLMTSRQTRLICESRRLSSEDVLSVFGDVLVKHNRGMIAYYDLRDFNGPLPVSSLPTCVSRSPLPLWLEP
jgi:hypothetical protein